MKVVDRCVWYAGDIRDNSDNNQNFVNWWQTSSVTKYSTHSLDKGKQTIKLTLILDMNIYEVTTRTNSAYVWSINHLFFTQHFIRTIVLVALGTMCVWDMFVMP